MIKLNASKFKATLAYEDYTAKSFAEKIKCHPTYISQLQNGKRQPSLTHAKRIMELLDCDWDDLFEEDK